MTRKCTAIIDASETWQLLTQSVNSLLAQRYEGIIEILVIVSEESIGQKEVSYSLSAMPWAFHVQMVPTGKEPLDRYLEQNPDTEFLFFLNAGDELMAGSVERFVGAFESEQIRMVLSPSRWSNGSETWAYPEVDDIFRLPASVRARPGAWESDFPDSSYTAYRPKVWLARDTEKSLQCAVVHDYLVRRHRAGTPPIDSCYRVPVDSLPSPESILAGPFPQPDLTEPRRKHGAWIFGERRGQAAEDNAWVLFEHCRRHRPEIECFYSLAQDAVITVPPEHEPFVVKIGTPAWRDAIARASHVFFTDSAADLFPNHSHVLEHPDLVYVYLTHGYLAYSPGVYQRGHPYFDRILCTSLEDVEVASREWAFPISRFVRTGLPRWDRLHTGCAEQKEILFCPTWRKSLGAPGGNLLAQPDSEEINAFEKSDYFRAVAGILSDARLGRYLDSNDARLILSLHFRLARYLQCFERFAGDRIRIISAQSNDRPMQRLLQDACALVTDYSSILWDMAYMEKPVVAYQFDKPAMLAERGREQFALSDSELPCVVCHCPDELFSALDALAQNRFSLDTRQLSLVDRFMPARDGRACARAIDAIGSAASVNGANAHYSHKVDLPSLFVSEGISDLTDGVRTASIIRGGVDTGLADHVTLAPDAWREQLKQPDLERVIVEPHLDARSDWADVFFDQVATVQLLADIAEACRQRGLSSELWISPVLPYADRLEGVAWQFDRVRKPDFSVETRASYDVSVIIPVYNGEDVVEASIDSVLDQDFSGRIEIIVVDDGSTDGTTGLVRRYAREHPGIVLLKQPNARQGMARNRGILAALGEFVMFLDADDRLSRDAVANLHFACELEKTDVAAGLVVSCGPDGKNQRVNQAYAHYRWAPPVIDLKRWPHLAFDPSCIGKLFRRSFLVENHLFFPQSYHEDQAFCAFLYASGAPIAVTKTVVCFYVAAFNRQSGTKTFSPEKLEQIVLVGNLVTRFLRASDVPHRLFEYFVAYLLMRYDRFLWKRAQSEVGQIPKKEEDRTIRRVGRFLQQIDESVILNNARRHPEVFMALKRGREELARKLLRGNVNAIGVGEELSQIADVSKPLEGGSVAKHQVYDYYSAVSVSQLICGGRQSDTPLVNDMCYGYRLGSPFVDAVKSPIKVLLIPHKLLHLAFDMATGRGRRKQEQRQKDLVNRSYIAAISHSNLIKQMAGYRLGVAFLEAMSGKPRVLRKLPENIRNIYRQTTSSD